jgi:hypothetical protein
VTLAIIILIIATLSIMIPTSRYLAKRSDDQENQFILSPLTLPLPRQSV